MAKEDKKIDKATADLLKALNKNNLTVAEMIRVFSRLGYTIGASLAGFEGKGPADIEVLKQEYYTHPTVDIALMLQALLIDTWVEDFLQNPVLSNLNNRLKSEEK